MATSNDVTNYEYQDLRAKIEEKLRGKPGWGDSYESSVGQNLIDIAADAADILSYMLERRSQESFQSTARLRSSVAAKSSELGYRSRRAVASNGTLTLDLVDEDGNPKPVATGGLITIDEGTEITFDDVTFTVTADYVIEEGVDSIDVEVTQGTKEVILIDPLSEQTFLDSGYILIPNYEYIDEFSLRVVSDNIEYQDVKVLDQENGIGIGSLSIAPERTGDQASAYYDVRFAQDGMRIQFGDDLFGMRPDSTVEISFIRTDGETVRVLTLDREFRFNFDTFGDGINVVPANEYEYVMKNSTQVVGGRPPETLNDIRINAPLFLTTNNRAVSLEGYSYWAKRSNVADIIDARAYAEAEIDTLLYNMNNVYISYLLESGGELLPTEKQELIDFVKERDVALAHIVTKSADEIQLGTEVSLKKSRDLQIGFSDLYVIVRDFLIDYYARRNGSIGKEYQKSDLIRDFYNLKTRVSGVDFNVTDFVDIDIYAYQLANYPVQGNNVIVRLRNDGSTAIAGDIFSLSIDGQNYDVTVTSDDINTGVFAANILFKMRDKLYLQTELISSIFVTSNDTDNEYVLVIESRDNLGSFTVESVFGDFVNDTLVNFRIQVFPKQFNNTSEDILLKNGVSIIDQNGQVLFYDNGQGFWVDASTGDVISLDPEAGTGTGGSGEEVLSSEMVDYVSAVLTLPELADGTYYVKYKQDKYDNFAANSSAAVTLIQPKETFEDVVETFSTITLISD